jgi:hypothetical protein
MRGPVEIGEWASDRRSGIESVKDPVESNIRAVRKLVRGTQWRVKNFRGNLQSLFLRIHEPAPIPAIASAANTMRGDSGDCDGDALAEGRKRIVVEAYGSPLVRRRR